ncbi:MAG: cytochrome c oxidase assembly protein [bacterium]|nr:cytochrome c oxidase assembly protein [bacterium]
MTTEALLLGGSTWSPAALVVIAATALVRWRIGGRAGLGFFLAGLGVMGLALCSPLDLLQRYLFSAHMAQHILLLLVVPPLLLKGLPARKGPRVPAAAGWIAGLGIMWLWHVPTLCAAAGAEPWIHRVQYVSLLAAGAAFWWPIVGPARQERLAPLAGVLYLFSACLACTLLGVRITFAPLSVCAAYLHPADPIGLLPLVREGWGMTPARDQELAGLLMWVPACFVYLTAILGLLGRWYGRPVAHAPALVASGGR